MDYKIRELEQNEISVLNTFFYEALVRKKGDICYVSECDNKIVGVVWVCIMNDYGHVDDEAPSFAISLLDLGHTLQPGYNHWIAWNITPAKRIPGGIAKGVYTYD